LNLMTKTMVTDSAPFKSSPARLAADLDHGSTGSILRVSA
jgi:hypothetical protein